MTWSRQDPDKAKSFKGYEVVRIYGKSCPRHHSLDERHRAWQILTDVPYQAFQQLLHLHSSTRELSLLGFKLAVLAKKGVQIRDSGPRCFKSRSWLRCGDWRYFSTFQSQSFIDLATRMRIFFTGKSILCKKRPNPSTCPRSFMVNTL